MVAYGVITNGGVPNTPLYEAVEAALRTQTAIWYVPGLGAVHTHVAIVL